MEPFPYPQHEIAMYADVPPSTLQTMVPEDEIEHLRKNVDHLRNDKRRLEERLRAVEQRKQQYKMAYEQARKAATSCGSGEQEISNLHEQLKAVEDLKDALYNHNMELMQRLEKAEKEGGKDACVICMDN